MNWQKDIHSMMLRRIGCDIEIEVLPDEQRDRQSQVRRHIQGLAQHSFRRWQQSNSINKTCRGFQVSISGAQLQKMTGFLRRVRENGDTLEWAALLPENKCYNGGELPTKLVQLSQEVFWFVQNIKPMKYPPVLYISKIEDQSQMYGHYHITILIPNGLKSEEYSQARDYLRSVYKLLDLGIWNRLYQEKDFAKSHETASLVCACTIVSAFNEQDSDTENFEGLDLSHRQSTSELGDAGSRYTQVRCQLCRESQQSALRQTSRKFCHSPSVIADFAATIFKKQDEHVKYIVDLQQTDPGFFLEKSFLCLEQRYRMLFELFRTLDLPDFVVIIGKLIDHLYVGIICNPVLDTFLDNFTKYVQSAIQAGVEGTFQTSLVLSGQGGSGKSTFVQRLCRFLLLPEDRLEVPQRSGRVNRVKSAVWSCLYNFDECFTSEAQSASRIAVDPLVVRFAPLLRFSCLETPITTLFQGSTVKPKTSLNILTGALAPSSLPSRVEYMLLRMQTPEAPDYATYERQAQRRIFFAHYTPEIGRLLQSELAIFSEEHPDAEMLRSVLFGVEPNQDVREGQNTVVDNLRHSRLQMFNNKLNPELRGVKETAQSFHQVVSDLLYGMLVVTAATGVSHAG